MLLCGLRFWIRQELLSSRDCKKMGDRNVEGVRIGKYVELTITSESPEAATKQLDRICDQLLANPVIENYRFELVEVATMMKAGA